MTHVRWLTRYGPEGASSRYRVFQYLDGLRDRGVSSTTSPLAPWKAPLPRQAAGIVRRVVDVARAGRDDAIIVVQKEPIMPPVAWWTCAPSLRRAHAALVWDVDDAVWLGHTGAASMATAMAQTADVVVAGNHLIADWMQRAGARRVEVVPTCFRPGRSPDTTDPDRDGDIVEVVWVGSPATARLLSAEQDMLRAVLANPRVRLTLVGGEIPGLAPAERVRTVAWSPDAEHRWLSNADYGLALQPRDEYADHKCGFKLIQYMSYGVVPIASDGPVHRQIAGDVGLLLGGLRPLDDVEDRLRDRPSAEERARAQQRWRERYDRAHGETAWSSILEGLA